MALTQKVHCLCDLQDAASVSSSSSSGWRTGFTGTAAVSIVESLEQSGPYTEGILCDLKDAMSVTESILCDLKDAMSVPSSSGGRTGFTGTAVGLTVQLTVQRWSLEHLFTESRLLITCKIPCLFLLLLCVEPGSVFLLLLCVEPG